MQKRHLGGLLLGLTLAFSGMAAAETVYVQDYLRLSVRSTPSSSGASVGAVGTGDALTVLATEGDYVKVRTAEGLEGWVSKGYVSEEKPARLQLEELRAEYDRNQTTTGELRKELGASKEHEAGLTKQLDGLKNENSSLQQQLSRYTSSTAKFARKYAWLFQGAFMIGLFLLGFYLGVRWYKRRLADRLGGLEI